MPRLVLSRNESEAIKVDGPAEIRIHRIRGNRVRLVIDAEASTKVIRTELLPSPKDAIDTEGTRPVAMDARRDAGQDGFPAAQRSGSAPV